MEDLDKAGKDWKVYFGDFPVSLQFNYVREHPFNVQEYHHFLDDAAAGTLPAFSFIEPRWFSLLNYTANIRTS